MKHFMGLIVGIVFLLGFQLNAFSGDAIKIGVVDLQKLQRDSSAFQKLSESYMKALDSKKQEFEKEKASMLALEEEMRKQNMMLSLDAKESKMKEYGKKGRRLKYLESELRQEAKEAEMELKRSVLIGIAKVVGDIGKKEGYSLILEKGSSGFLYSDDSIDITDRVIKAYDQVKR
jgi:outer membrane protein